MKRKLTLLLMLFGLAVFASGCIVPVGDGGGHRDWGWHREHWRD